MAGDKFPLDVLGDKIPEKLPKPVLDAVARPGIAPAQRLREAGDQAGAAFQAALVVDQDAIALVQRVEPRRADVQAIADGAAGPAHLVVDDDVRLFPVHLEDVQPELGLQAFSVCALA